jgi:hypothetical protein
VTSTTLDTELMQRALQEIDQLLCALEAPARAHQCLPRDEFSAAPYEQPGARQAPTPSVSPPLEYSPLWPFEISPV